MKIILIVLVLVLIVVGIYYMMMTSKTESEQQVTNLSSSDIAVDIVNFEFLPATITINRGDTVVWTNSDTAPHDVTFTQAGATNSARMITGDTYRYTFANAGIYDYYCSIHPNMKARVIVE
jgi:plastocyanin